MEEVTPYISSVTKRGQTVVPRKLREILAVREGDHLVWELRGSHVQVEKLTLKEREEKLSLTEAEWKKLDQLVREQEAKGQYTRYSSIRAAKRHLRNPAKHGS